MRDVASHLACASCAFTMHAHDRSLVPNLHTMRPQDCKSVLPHVYGEFVRKCWNPRMFKGQVPSISKLCIRVGVRARCPSFVIVPDIPNSI